MLYVWLAGSLLKGTALSFLVPISDAIVVLSLVLWMAPHPIRMFSKALGEVVGAPVEPQVASGVREAVENALRKNPFTVLEVPVTKAGRSLFAVAYVKPQGAVDAAAFDAACEDATTAFAAAKPNSRVRMELLVKVRHPYRTGVEGQPPRH